MPHKQTEEQADRTRTHGSSWSTADMATDSGRGLEEQRDNQAPHARKAEPLPADQKPDQLAEKEASSESRQEALLDEAVEETFPGSDPISPKHIT
jgi:hypothetical protein